MNEAYRKPVAPSPAEEKPPAPIKWDRVAAWSMIAGFHVALAVLWYAHRNADPNRFAFGWVVLGAFVSVCEAIGLLVWSVITVMKKEPRR